MEFYGFGFKSPSKTQMLKVCLPAFGAIGKWLSLQEVMSCGSKSGH
jgi:hypothetical protein